MRETANFLSLKFMQRPRRTAHSVFRRSNRFGDRLLYIHLEEQGDGTGRSVGEMLLNRGLMDDELFFENNTEFWIVWQRLKNLAPQARTAYNNPRLYRNIESAVGRIEAYWQRTMPGYLETQTKRVAAMFEQFSKSAHKPS